MDESFDFIRRIIPATETMFLVPTAAAPAFTGAGDIVSGAYAWWGLRAYTAASIGGNVVKLRRDSDNATQIFTSQTNGGLDSGAISAFKGAANLFVDTLYDQTGNGHDLVQSTAGAQPGFSLSGLGSLPILTFDGATQFLTAAVVGGSDQPIPYSFAGTSNGGAQSAKIMWATTVPDFETGFNGSNGVYTFLGSQIPATGADNTWLALIPISNAASSSIYVNGTQTTGSFTSSSFFSTSQFTMGGWVNGTQLITGSITELGFWLVDLGANAAALTSNIRTYWGF